MKITEYVSETKAEMKHVNWPTRRQAIAFTVIVLVIAIGVAALLGVFDYVFTTGLQKLIG